MFTSKYINEWAYLGIRKCPACENHCDFWIGEYIKRIRVLWIPLFATTRHRISICGICDEVWKLDMATQNELLRESIDVPPQEIVWDLWHVIEAGVAAQAEQMLPGDAGEALELSPHSISAEIRRLKDDYPSRYVDYVGQRFMLWLRDSSEVILKRSPENL